MNVMIVMTVMATTVSLSLSSSEEAGAAGGWNEGGRGSACEWAALWVASGKGHVEMVRILNNMFQGSHQNVQL